MTAANKRFEVRLTFHGKCLCNRVFTFSVCARTRVYPRVCVFVLRVGALVYVCVGLCPCMFAGMHCLLALLSFINFERTL